MKKFHIQIDAYLEADGIEQCLHALGQKYIDESYGDFDGGIEFLPNSRVNIEPVEEV